MTAKKIYVHLRVARPIFRELAYSLLPISMLEAAAADMQNRATLLFDFAPTWALRELNRMSIWERARTVVFTTVSNLVYLDAIAAFHVSGIIVPERLDSLHTALYAAAFAMRTYSRGTDLTPTELRLVRLLLAGYDTKKMAEEMGVSPKTVNAHFSNILQKLNLTNRIDILAEVLRPEPPTL